MNLEATRTDAMENAAILDAGETEALKMLVAAYDEVERGRKIYLETGEKPAWYYDERQKFTAYRTMWATLAGWCSNPYKCENIEFLTDYSGDTYGVVAILRNVVDGTVSFDCYRLD